MRLNSGDPCDGDARMQIVIGPASSVGVREPEARGTARRGADREVFGETVASSQ
jgi:hypothetical protein